MDTISKYLYQSENMRELILLLGQKKTVILIASVSVLVSLLFSFSMRFMIFRFFGIYLHYGATAFISISIPLVIATVASWVFVGLVVSSQIIGVIGV